MKMVPNVVTTVEGEETLFEKLSHQLQMVEDWVSKIFTGDTVMDYIAALATGDTPGEGEEPPADPPRDLTDEPEEETPAEFTMPESAIWQHLASLIVAETLYRAIPGLDVVLTPNGFGIVSNQNVAPASKDRVERLINKMGALRDHYINMLLDDLRLLEAWRTTDQYKWFTASLISWPKACVTAVMDRIREGQQWDTFLQLRERAILIEDAIAEKWISPEVMANLRTVLYTGQNPTVHQVALKVRSCVFQELRGEPRNHWNLDRIVNFIRNNGSLFPEWATSATAKLYNEATIFKNKKDSPGYFF